MLVLSGGQAESLFDLGLPVEVAELPADLAALDALLNDRALLAPIEAAWAVEHRDHGRPSVAMERFVRLMIVKARLARPPEIGPTRVRVLSARENGQGGTDNGEGKAPPPTKSSESSARPS